MVNLSFLVGHCDGSSGWFSSLAIPKLLEHDIPLKCFNIFTETYRLIQYSKEQHGYLFMYFRNLMVLVIGAHLFQNFRFLQRMLYMQINMWSRYFLHYFLLD